MASFFDAPSMQQRVVYIGRRAHGSEHSQSAADCGLTSTTRNGKYGSVSERARATRLAVADALGHAAAVKKVLGFARGKAAGCMACTQPTAAESAARWQGE